MLGKLKIKYETEAYQMAENEKFRIELTCRDLADQRIACETQEGELIFVMSYSKFNGYSSWVSTDWFKEDQSYWDLERLLNEAGLKVEEIYWEPERDARTRQLKLVQIV